MEAYGLQGNEVDMWPTKTCIMTDCDSLWSNTRSLTVNIKERALIRELTVFREALAQGVLEEFRWVPTNIQLADSLTKIMESTELIKSIKTGEIRLKPTSEELSSKKGSLKKEFIHFLPEDMVIRGRPQALINLISEKIAHFPVLKAAFFGS